MKVAVLGARGEEGTLMGQTKNKLKSQGRKEREAEREEKRPVCFAAAAPSSLLWRGRAATARHCLNYQTLKPSMRRHSLWAAMSAAQ